MNAAETLLSVRRMSYQQIKSICASNISDRDKISNCINASSIYAALTGDDSLTPPLLRAERQTQIDSLPAILKTADKKQKQKERGIVELF